MEKQDIIEGSKIIANYLGWVYIPFNDLQGLTKPGWYQVATNINSLAPLVYHTKNGWIKLGDKFYRYICRNHSELRFYNSMDELIKVIEKIQKDWSVEKYSYSWEMGSHNYYNFNGFKFNLCNNGAYSQVNWELDPPEEIVKSFDSKLNWTQNVFKVVVDTILYIDKIKQNNDRKEV